LLSAVTTSVADPNPDPHIFGPDPLVKGIDPDPSIIKQKGRKKNLDSYCFVASFGLFIF
jgi:hypothetical protein